MYLNNALLNKTVIYLTNVNKVKDRESWEIYPHDTYKFFNLFLSASVV